MKVEFTPRERRNGDIRHGTPTGANQHSQAGEDPCDACRAAKREYDQRRMSSDENKRKNRLHATAQRLALKDVKDAHLEEYRAAYVKHKAALMADYIRENGGAR